MVSAHIARGPLDQLQVFELSQRSPLEPQTFYPIENKDLVLNPTDILTTRCQYNTTGFIDPVKFGKDLFKYHLVLINLPILKSFPLGYFYPGEMCGLYVAYHVKASSLTSKLEDFILCEGEEIEGLSKNMIFNSLAKQPTEMASK